LGFTQCHIQNLLHLTSQKGAQPYGEKGKHGWFLTHESGFCHQNHHQMNVCIINDAHVIQKHNDQKVVK
jgi:hypothetical protein